MNFRRINDPARFTTLSCPQKRSSSTDDGNFVEEVSKHQSDHPITQRVTQYGITHHISLHILQKQLQICLSCTVSKYYTTKVRTETACALETPSRLQRQTSRAQLVGTPGQNILQYVQLTRSVAKHKYKYTKTTCYNTLESNPRLLTPILNSARNPDTIRLAIKNQLTESNSQSLFPATCIKNLGDDPVGNQESKSEPRYIHSTT